MTPEDLEQIRQIVAAAEQRMGQRTEQLIAAAEQRTEQLIAASEQRMKEHATETGRELQTELLRGLEGFARGNFARFHAVESAQSDLSIRMAAIEERVLYLETRRNQQQ